ALPKDHGLTIGDKVLVYRASQEHSRSNKLDPKWVGPFYIHEIRPKAVYRLRTLDGKVWKKPINRRLLKKYMEH
ncbi:6478_t:CDS:1, partial [Acaulospora morrowiae]